MEEIRGVLVIGATGYLGRRIVQQCLVQGLPTFLLMRPDAVSDINKSQLLISYKQAGAHLVEGCIDDYDSLVNALRKVDIVISAISEDQLLKQLVLVNAIKEVGTIKRFLPSEFGLDVDKMGDALAEANVLFAEKRRVRRAIEEAGIAFTYVSANCFAGYFLAGLAQYSRFMPPLDKIVIYGDGNAKVVWVEEEDAAKYAVRALREPRTVNKVMYIRPRENIMSQMEVVQTWERLSGRLLQKRYFYEDEWIAMIKDKRRGGRSKVEMAIFYHIFYKGELANFEIEHPTQCEATQLFPDVQYTCVETYLKRFV